jgi:protein SCO1/2
MSTATPAAGQAFRRRWLIAGAALALAPRLPRAHESLGPVEPRRPLPPLALNLHDGQTRPLADLLRGRITAMQLMFTGCSAVCPIQGAVFAALQEQVHALVPRAQLLSVSIDPLSDDAAALARWRDKFKARHRWLAGAPPVRHSEVMLDFVNGRSVGAGSAADRHSPMTYLIDDKGRLAFRCAELAPAADIARAMRELDRRG